MNVDFSCLAEENHAYAIHLATFQNVITYKKGSYGIADISCERNPFEAENNLIVRKMDLNFWGNIE